MDTSKYENVLNYDRDWEKLVSYITVYETKEEKEKALKAFIQQHSRL